MFLAKPKERLKPKKTKDGKYMCPYDNKEFDTVHEVETCIEKHMAKIVPG